MSLNKKILLDTASFLFLLIYSFFINQYYGFIGITPLDDFLNYNCGYRILLGDIPFKDYYSVTGAFLCSIQSIFFKFFGINWTSFVSHASVFNSMLCVVLFYFLRKYEVSNLVILIFCLCISTLAYPNNGVPGVDHHSWILSLISLLFFYMAFSERNGKFIIISSFLLFFSFLVKQVPSTYFLILFFFIYAFFSIKDKNFYFLKELIITILLILFIFLLYLKIYSIDISLFFNQYILLPLNLGSNRLEGATLNFILEKISNIYFLFFLIIPLSIQGYFILSFKKKIFENFLFLNFIICLYMILISLFYEIHTNNSAMTFITLPIVVFFLSQIQKQIGEIKFLKYIYIILIFYSWFRLFQFDIIVSLLNILFIILLFIFFYSKKRNFFSNQNLLIVYLIFSSYYYFQTSVDFRKYKDVNINNKDLIFNGSKIDRKFKNVQWITSYGINQEEEVKSIKYKINLLERLDGNFILISDYQIFNSILELKDFSPVKYWHTGVSYPDITSHNRSNFEIFFKSKLINKNVKYIILDDKASVFEENIEDYKFLYECLKMTKKTVQYNIKIYKLNIPCLRKFN